MTEGPSVVLLTTETTHHLYFAEEISRLHPLRAILVETGVAAAPFETFHPFEAERETYEREALLGGRAVAFEGIAETLAFASMNEPDAVAALRRLAPDVVVVFGTGRLRADIIEAARVACLNLHGGDPEKYRGLDTHLWAIYHRDFAALVSTLHHIDSGIDTGPIVERAPLEIPRGARLAHLRAMNTRICVEMTGRALAALRATGEIPAVPQRQLGRYYSFMPAALKEVCVRNFDRYVAALK